MELAPEPLDAEACDLAGMEVDFFEGLFESTAEDEAFRISECQSPAEIVYRDIPDLGACSSGSSDCTDSLQRVSGADSCRDLSDSIELESLPTVHSSNTEVASLQSGAALGVFISADELRRQQREKRARTPEPQDDDSGGDSGEPAKRRIAVPKYSAAAGAVQQQKPSAAALAKAAREEREEAARVAKMSPAELRVYKKEKKKERNRQLAAESRERRKQKMTALEQENIALKQQVRELQLELKATRAAACRCTEGRRAAASASTRQKAKDSTLMKGAAAMGLTMSMVVFTDTTGGESPASDVSFEMIGFWAVGWDLLRGAGLSMRQMLPHFFALLFGVCMTLGFVSLYYFRTLHHRRAKLLAASLLPTNTQAKPATKVT